MKTTARILCGLFFALVFVSACGFDDTLRAYLDAHFWLPFSKHAGDFEKRGIRRVSAPYAGMLKAAGSSPLDKLRAAYQEISQPNTDFDAEALHQAGAQPASAASSRSTAKGRARKST